MVARRRRQVVLPEPLTPSSPKICPGSQRKFTWSTARISPRFLSRKSLVNWRVSITRHWLVCAEDARAAAHWQARLKRALREGRARRAGQPSLPEGGWHWRGGGCFLSPCFVCFVCFCAVFSLQTFALDPIWCCPKKTI